MRFEPHINFLNKHNTKSNTFKLHSHNCYELVYFLNGSGKTIIEDKSFVVKEHSYCIVPPETKHIECIDGYGEILFIGFNLDDNSIDFKEGVYHNRDISLFSLINEIFNEYKRQELGFQTASNAFLKLFLISVLRNFTKDSQNCKDLNYIKEYIDQHFDQKIDFKQLSLLSGYSYDYFRHIFKQKFGLAPKDYMIDIRLNTARQLLRNTDLSCTQIAYKCGFSNSAQLTAMFKEKFGYPPTKITDSYKD